MSKQPEANGKPDAQAMLKALAHFAPVFDAPGFQFATMKGGSAPEAAITVLPYCDFSREAMDFIGMAYEFGWVRSFDWPKWIGTSEAKRFMDNPGQVARATRGQLAKLLTVHVRGERFSDGTLFSAFESGLLTAIAKRAAVLLKP